MTFQSGCVRLQLPPAKALLTSESVYILAGVFIFPSPWISLREFTHLAYTAQLEESLVPGWGGEACHTAIHLHHSVFTVLMIPKPSMQDILHSLNVMRMLCLSRNVLRLPFSLSFSFCLSPAVWSEALVVHPKLSGYGMSCWA